MTLLTLSVPVTGLASPTQARVVTMTYLKSEPGKLDQLERYVRANWFAMDAEAVRQGLFVSYEWLDTGSDDGAWNALVMVTYNDERGFAGIEQRWAAIKAAHKERRINGAGMKQLGRVVETKTLFERQPFLAKGMQTANLSDAPGSHSLPTSPVDLLGARQAVEEYFRAADSGKAENVRDVFWPSGRFEGVSKGTLISMSGEEFATKNFKGQPPSYINNVKRTIEWVNVSGPAGVARVKIEIGTTAVYFDYFILYRVNGVWKVGLKAFANPD